MGNQQSMNSPKTLFECFSKDGSNLDGDMYYWYRKGVSEKAQVELEKIIEEAQSMADDELKKQSNELTFEETQQKKKQRR